MKTTYPMTSPCTPENALKDLEKFLLLLASCFVIFIFRLVTIIWPLARVFSGIVRVADSHYRIGSRGFLEKYTVSALTQYVIHYTLYIIHEK